MAELVIKLVNGELAGKTMQDLTKQISAASSALKKAEIGTKEWVAANEKLEKAKSLQGDLKKQIESTTSASDHLKAAWTKLPGSEFFNKISSSFSTLKGGVGGLTSQFGVLKTAIISTGIGALVIAVIALATWFSKTEAGGDLLAKGMAILEAIFRQVTESISRLMRGDLIGFFRGVTTEMKEQIVAANGLADAVDALEEAESAFGVVQKAGLRDRAEALKMSKDETLSLKDRVAALDRAMGISKGINDQELKNQREHLRIISGGEAAIGDELIKRLEKTGLTMENAKEFFKKGNITQADLDEANEALEKFLDIQENAFNDERELLVNRNKLTGKQKKESSEADKKEGVEKKNLLEQQRKDLEEEYAAMDNIRRLENEKRLANIEDDREREKEAVNIATEEKIVNLQGSESQILEQIALLREIQGQELAAIDEKYAAKKAEGDKKNNELAEQQAQEHVEKMKAIRKSLAEHEAEVESIRLDTFRVGVAGFGELLDKQIENEKQAREIRKAFAVADIGIGLAQELAANSAAGAKISAEAPPFTIPAGIAYTATANVRSLVRAGIATAKILLFKKGGYTGEGDADEPAGIVHKKEYVVPAHITQNPRYAGLINRLEAARLRGYQMGGPVSPYENRSPSGDLAAAKADGGSMGGVQRLEEFLIQNFQAINKRIDRIKVINVATETEAAIKVVNQIREDASV